MALISECVGNVDLRIASRIRSSGSTDDGKPARAPLPDDSVYPTVRQTETENKNVSQKIPQRNDTRKAF